MSDDNVMRACGRERHDDEPVKKKAVDLKITSEWGEEDAIKSGTSKTHRSSV